MEYEIFIQNHPMIHDMSVMLDEIHEEPDIIIPTHESNKESIIRACSIIRESSMVYITGSGTSFHAAEFLSMLLLKSGVPAVAVQASDYADLIPGGFKGTVLNIIFSQSGESADALSDLKISRKHGIKVIGITNEKDSRLSRESDIAIVTLAGRERSVAATKSHTAQQVVSILLYCKLNSIEPEGKLKSIHDGIQTILNREIYIQRISEKVSGKLVILGSGLDFPVAMEADLKFKETSGINVESHSTREYLHGPIHRLDEKSTVILMRGDESKDSTVIRRVTEITDNIITIGQSDSDIVIPEAGIMERPLLFLTVMQLISNFKAISLGMDPDHPTNLTKVVRE
jgi:glucosamine--fructose-6-phosphate aminotransferase (isomerizing)